MNIVNMLLNPHSTAMMSRTSRAQMSTGPGHSGRFASVEFSRVLDDKLSSRSRTSQVETGAESKFQKKVMDSRAQNSARPDRAEEVFGEQQNQSKPEQQPMRALEDSRGENEVFREASRKFAERKEDGRNAGQQGKQSDQPSSEQSREQTLAEIVREEYGADGKQALENLTEKQRQVVEKIKDGSFDLSSKDDVKQLKELLEKFADDGTGGQKEEVLSLLEELFSSDKMLESLFEGDTSPEKLAENLKSLQDLLKETKNLLEKWTESVNGAVLGRLEEGFEKLTSGDGQGDNAKELTQLLENIREALNKEGSTETEFISQIKQVVEQAEKLAQQLEKQLGNGNQPAPSEQKNLLKNLKQLAQQLDKALKTGEESGGKSEASKETLKQFEKAMQTVEKVVDRSEDKEKLARQLASVKMQADGKASSEKSNGKSVEAKSNGAGQGETAALDDQATDAQRTDQSADKVKNGSEEAKQSENSQRAQRESEQPSKTTSESVEKETVKDKESSPANSSRNSRELTENEAKAREQTERSKDAKEEQTSKNKRTPVKGQSSKSASEESAKKAEASNNANSKAAQQAASGEASSSESVNPDKIRPDASQAANQSVQAAERSQESARVRGEFRASPSPKTQEQSTVTADPEKTIEKVNNREQTDAQKFQVAEPDPTKHSNQAEKKHAGKMIQYEANAVQATANAEGSDTQFSQSGQQQQHQSFQGSAASQTFRGSNFSQRMLEARQVIDQMVERAQTMVDEGKQTMKIQLQPEVLGEMKMSVTLEGDEVKAKVQVEKQAVKTLLDENMQDLKMAMEQIGVELDDVDISESDDGEAGADFWFDEDRAARAAEQEEDVVEDNEAAPVRGHMNPTREYSSIELVA